MALPLAGTATGRHRGLPVRRGPLRGHGAVAAAARDPPVIRHLGARQPGGSAPARQERQQLDGLLRAAAAAHASMQPADVEDAVIGSARELLACRQARLSENPPAAGELGCRLPGASYPERWLVVADRRGIESFGP